MSVCVLHVFYQEELSALHSALGTKKEEVKRLQKQLTTLDTATSPSSLTDEVLKAKVSDHASFDFQMYDKVTCTCYCMCVSTVCVHVHLFAYVYMYIIFAYILYVYMYCTFIPKLYHSCS